jgi:hypothetical protein
MITARLYVGADRARQDGVITGQDKERAAVETEARVVTRR